jgi:membrane protease YdiL (CAAX protease family)
LNSEVEGEIADSSGRLSKTRKLIALVEVIVVRFVVYALIALALLQLAYGSLDPSPFPLEASYLIGTLWFVIPTLMIYGLRRNPKEYGLSISRASQSVDLALNAFPFYVLTNLGFVILIFMNWSYLEPLGALVLTGFFTLALWLIVRMVSQKYDHFEDVQISQKKHRNNVLSILFLLLLPVILGLALSKLSWALVSTVVWQFIFSGFGEEIFFRGYVQSRLNAGFGRPYEWKGIRFGAGLFITAAIFAATHVLNTANIWLGDFNMAWWWGTFTFVGGILFGLLREKTKSVVAPGVLHGLEAVGEGLGLLF